MTKGTAHFVSIHLAWEYYWIQGYDRNDVLQKLTDGEIFIGPPDLKDGEKLMLLDSGTRYGIKV